MTILKQWLEIGQKNHWIKRAYDPRFTLESFVLCETEAELLDKLCGEQSWCLGQAFYIDNICFIQQVDGGDEWLVIRDNLAFESYSCRAIGRAKLTEYLERIRRATPEDLKNLDY